MNEMGLILLMLAVSVGFLFILLEIRRQLHRQDLQSPRRRLPANPKVVRVLPTPYERRETFSRADFVPYQYRDEAA